MTIVNYNLINKEKVNHIFNLMKSYQKKQHDNSNMDNIDLNYIYEFTAHLRNSAGSTCNIPIKLDKIFCMLQRHLSQQFLGKSYTKFYKQKLQPILVSFFDYEGTRQGKTLDVCTSAHLHGFLILHPKNRPFFDNVFKPELTGRFSLVELPNGLKSLSIQPAYGGEEGIKKCVDYFLKLEKLESKTGKIYYGYDVYPKIELWNNYIAEVSM